MVIKMTLTIDRDFDPKQSDDDRLLFRVSDQYGSHGYIAVSKPSWSGVKDTYSDPIGRLEELANRGGWRVYQFEGEDVIDVLPGAPSPLVR
jgi:hypothetical protein